MDTLELEGLRNRDFLEQNPPITVVIPTYKKPELAAVAVKSIVNQTDRNFQLIIVDDEATGDKVNPIEAIVNEIQDDRIIYFKNESNLGVYGNWNRCISLCKSKWVCMVHDDTFCRI